MVWSRWGASRRSQTRQYYITHLAQSNHALPMRRRSALLARCMAAFSRSLPATLALRMVPTMALREPSMRMEKKMPTNGLRLMTMTMMLMTRPMTMTMMMLMTMVMLTMALRAHFGRLGAVVSLYLAVLGVS